MAGTDASFNQAEFEQGIRFAMQMGMPPDASKRLTFHWGDVKEFTPQDSAHNPYDWSSSPTSSEPGNPEEPDGALQVLYAIEFSARPAGSDETVFGQLDTSRAVVTLFATEYEQVKDADYASIDGSRYRIDFTGPPMGLFESGIYSVYLTAFDEK